METCKYIKATKPFIYINVAEAQGVEYNERLAHAVRLMDVDGSILKVFDNLWKNESVIKNMIDILRKTRSSMVCSFCSPRKFKTKYKKMPPEENIGGRRCKGGYPLNDPLPILLMFGRRRGSFVIHLILELSMRYNSIYYTKKRQQSKQKQTSTQTTSFFDSKSSNQRKQRKQRKQREQREQRGQLTQAWLLA